MSDPTAVPVTEQTPIVEQPIADAGPRRCPACGRRVRGVVDAETNAFTPVKTKSGIQKRLDQITRQRYEALRQTETLRDDLVAAMAKLKQAEHLLGQYKDQLEKYRAKFIEIVAKEKHVPR